MSEVEYGVYGPRRGGGVRAAAGPLVGLVGLAACAAVGFVAAASLASARAGANATPDDVALVAKRLIDSWPFLLSVAAPALLFVAAGGYVAARAAQSEGARRALPVGIASSVAAGLVVFVSPVSVPPWLAAALVVAPLPAALFGVALRRLGARRARAPRADARQRPAQARAAEPVFPQPPAHAAEEERALASRLAGAVAAREAQATPRATAFARDASATGRLEALDGLRAAVRAALLTHPAATEEDFERCWPAIRDEIFKQHTLRVYNSRPARDGGER